MESMMKCISIKANECHNKYLFSSEETKSFSKRNFEQQGMLHLQSIDYEN